MCVPTPPPDYGFSRWSYTPPGCRRRRSDDDDDAGEHGGIAELQRQVLPLLESAKADAYISGHDHTLREVTGLGSKGWENWESGAGPKRKRN